jgi:hypothetical protein
MYRVALNVAISQVRRVAGDADRLELLQQQHLEFADAENAETDDRTAAAQVLDTGWFRIAGTGWWCVLAAAPSRAPPLARK